MKKHLYVFKVECDNCKKPFKIKLELQTYIEPDWLIYSVPIKNICELCNVRSEVKYMLNSIKNTCRCA